MSNRLRFRRALPLLFALLAFAGLMGRGALPPVGAAEGAANLGMLASLGATICHGDPAGDEAPAGPGQRHAPDCALCPVCQIQSPAAQLLQPAAPVILAAPVSRRMAPHVLAEARAPPGTAWRAARPRGPPLLS
jgi:hypothetical protein